MYFGWACWCASGNTSARNGEQETPPEKLDTPRGGLPWLQGHLQNKALFTSKSPKKPFGTASNQDALQRRNGGHLDCHSSANYGNLPWVRDLVLSGEDTHESVAPLGSDGLHDLKLELLAGLTSRTKTHELLATTTNLIAMPTPANRRDDIESSKCQALQLPRRAHSPDPG